MGCQLYLNFGVFLLEAEKCALYKGKIRSVVRLASPRPMHQGMHVSLQMLVHSDNRIRPTGVWPGDRLDNPNFAGKTSLIQ